MEKTYVSEGFNQRLHDLAARLVTQERFGAVVMAPVVELRAEAEPITA